MWGFDIWSRKTYRIWMSHKKLWSWRKNLNVIAHLDVLVVHLTWLKIGRVHKPEVQIQWLQDEVTELSVKGVVPKLHRTADFCPCRLCILKVCFSLDVHDSTVAEADIIGSALDMADLQVWWEEGDKVYFTFINGVQSSWRSLISRIIWPGLWPRGKLKIRLSYFVTFFDSEPFVVPIVGQEVTCRQTEGCLGNLCKMKIIDPSF